MPYMEQQQHTTGGERTVYHRGASDGLIMGLYMAVMYVLQVSGLRAPMLSLLGEAMMLGVPVAAYMLMRRGVRETAPPPVFSAIWMHGIMIFLCGSIIMALVAYVYMRFVTPTFIVDLFRTMAELYAGMGTDAGQEFSRVLERVIEARMLPTPISFAFSLMWLASFGGAMLSLLLAGILKWRMASKKSKNEPN